MSCPHLTMTMSSSLVWSVPGSICSLERVEGGTADYTSLMFLQQWGIPDPCARLLAGESYQVAQALEVFQCYLPATSPQSHGGGSTGEKGVMLLFDGCLLCSVNH